MIGFRREDKPKPGWGPGPRQSTWCARMQGIAENPCLVIIQNCLLSLSLVFLVSPSCLYRITGFNCVLVAEHWNCFEYKCISNYRPVKKYTEPESANEPFWTLGIWPSLTPVKCQPTIYPLLPLLCWKIANGYRLSTRHPLTNHPVPGGLGLLPNLPRSTLKDLHRYQDRLTDHQDRLARY